MEQTYQKSFPYAPLGYLAITIIYFCLMIFASEIDANALAITGIIISILGYIPWIVARRELGNSLTIKPEARKLVTSGIYSKIQHPLYISQTLVLLGLALFLQSWIFGLLCVGGYILLSIYRGYEEHRVLRNAFGEEYEVYASKTWF